MISVMKRHTFSAAHRLYDYNGQCEQLHGHNYTVEVTLSSEELDPLGMVLDFAEIKRMLIEALDRIWDHRTILFVDDPLAKQLPELLNDNSVFVLPRNPTAENMAWYLGTVFFPGELASHEVCETIRVQKVTIYETENNSATWQAN